jgi:NAD(P)-dependent dehydrogenase (short-subunit alcohol dehydrogenase family)
MAALQDKVAIVTGATSGIGERIAAAFVAEGAKVVAVGRREAEGSDVEKRLGLRFIRADVSKEAEVKVMVERTIDLFGRVDCLVNNAGVPSPMISIAETDIANFDETIAINVRGVLLGMKHVAPTMIARGSGSIINIASIAGHVGGVSAHSYSASKGAVIALSRSVAAELGEKGVRVNSISPGAIVTGIFGKNAGVEGPKADKVAEVVKEMFATLQPIPRAGAGDDIAKAAVFLASDGASFVNGQDILVDGGLSAVSRGWSATVAGRAQAYQRIKDAAAAL